MARPKGIPAWNKGVKMPKGWGCSKDADNLEVNYFFQYSIDKYLVDFYIPSKNLIIEVDGNYWHKYPYGTENDKIKDKRLNELGYQVIRFWESDLKNMKTIVL